MIKSLLSVGGFTILSRLTGLLRDTILSGVLGAAGLMDLFGFGFRLTNHFRAIFGEGRSVEGGTNRVHQRLKPCRAITLCCTANKPSSMVLMSMLSISGPAAPESIDFGTTRLLTKPIAYSMVTRNTA